MTEPWHQYSCADPCGPASDRRQPFNDSAAGATSPAATRSNHPLSPKRGPSSPTPSYKPPPMKEVYVDDNLNKNSSKSRLSTKSAQVLHAPQSPRAIATNGKKINLKTDDGAFSSFASALMSRHATTKFSLEQAITNTFGPEELKSFTEALNHRSKELPMFSEVGEPTVYGLIRAVDEKFGTTLRQMSSSIKTLANDETATNSLPHLSREYREGPPTPKQGGYSNRNDSGMNIPHSIPRTPRGSHYQEPKEQTSPLTVPSNMNRPRYGENSSNHMSPRSFRERPNSDVYAAHGGRTQDNPLSMPNLRHPPEQQQFGNSHTETSAHMSSRQQPKSPITQHSQTPPADSNQVPTHQHQVFSPRTQQSQTEPGISWQQQQQPQQQQNYHSEANHPKVDPTVQIQFTRTENNNNTKGAPALFDKTSPNSTVNTPKFRQFQQQQGLQVKLNSIPSQEVKSPETTTLPNVEVDWNIDKIPRAAQADSQAPVAENHADEANILSIDDFDESSLPQAHQSQISPKNTDDINVSAPQKSPRKSQNVFRLDPMDSRGSNKNPSGKESKSPGARMSSTVSFSVDSIRDPEDAVRGKQSKSSKEKNIISSFFSSLGYNSKSSRTESFEPAEKFQSNSKNFDENSLEEGKLAAQPQHSFKSVVKKSSDPRLAIVQRKSELLQNQAQALKNQAELTTKLISEIEEVQAVIDETNDEGIIKAYEQYVEELQVELDKANGLNEFGIKEVTPSPSADIAMATRSTEKKGNVNREKRGKEVGNENSIMASVDDKLGMVVDGAQLEKQTDRQSRFSQSIELTPRSLSAHKARKRDAPYTRQMVSERKAKMRVARVYAPSDMPGGYKFEARIGDEIFMAVVPKQGVRKGEVFETTIGDLYDKGKLIDPDRVRTFRDMDAPPFRWRDELFDCFRHGIDHPFVCNSIFCPHVALSQVMARVQVGGHGDKLMNLASRDRVGSVSRFMFSVFLIHAAFAVYPIFYAIPEKNLALIVTTPLLTFDLFLLCYFFYMVTKTRRILRREYDIPELRCKGCEDVCLSLFCTCCTISQMGRHTADYETYRAYCCTDTGLAKHMEVKLPNDYMLQSNVP